MGILDTLPATVAAALDGLMSAATIIKQAARVPDGRGGATRADGDEVPCRAIVTEFSTFAKLAAAGVITERDRQAIIMAASLAGSPAVGDSLVIGGERLEVMDVSRDPAAATWTLRVRK